MGEGHQAATSWQKFALVEILVALVVAVVLFVFEGDLFLAWDFFLALVGDGFFAAVAFDFALEGDFFLAGEGFLVAALNGDGLLVLIAAAAAEVADVDAPLSIL